MQPLRSWVAKVTSGPYSPLVAVAAVIAGLGLLECLLPLRTTVQIGADEGMEVAKAELCLKGHQLYTEIWNDQPPLHTFLVTFVLRHFSSTMLGPRLLTVAFAVVLLIAVYLIVSRFSGDWVGVLAAGFLIGSPGFLDLSSSCMLEIPSLATAVAALCVLRMRWRAEWRLPELLSGALFAAALQIKLVPSIYLALVPLVFWLERSSSSKTTKQLVLSLGLFAVSLFAFYVLVDAMIEGGAYLHHFQQTWQSHFGDSKSLEYGSAQDFPFQWVILFKNWDLTLPAIVGVAFLAQSSRTSPGHLLPLAWLALTLLVFGIHRPWWPYYYVHLAVPLSWCAAAGIVGLAGACKPGPKVLRLGLLGLFALCCVPWIIGRLYLEASGIRHSPQTFASPVLAQVARFKPFTKSLFADRPIYSFHTDIPLPSNLAVLPVKRFWAGEMTNAKLTSELGDLKPGLLLLENDTRERPFHKLLETEYRLVYVDTQNRLYAHSSIAKRALFWSSVPPPH